jgi:hypothetical protein
MIRARVRKALEGRTDLMSGRDVANAAGLPYKVTIDALGWLHDTGSVVRIGRKHNAAWALAESPAAIQPDPMCVLEALWKGRTK